MISQSSRLSGIGRAVERAPQRIAKGFPNGPRSLSWMHAMRPLVAISIGFAAALTALTFCWPHLVHASRGLCGEVRSTAGRLLAGAQVTLLRADADGRAVALART